MEMTEAGSVFWRIGIPVWRARARCTCKIHRNRTRKYIHDKENFRCPLSNICSRQRKKKMKPSVEEIELFPQQQVGEVKRARKEKIHRLRSKT